jgi:hypothetical protein
LYQYPQGPTPLTYLLSLLPDEETDKTEFGWWEERDTVISTTTVTANAAGPFTTPTSTVGGAAGTDKTVAGWNAVVGTQVDVFLTDATLFRVQDVVWVRNLLKGTPDGTYLQFRAVVTLVGINNTTTGAGFIRVNPIEAVTSISNDADSNGLTVYFVSSAAAEGTKSKVGSYSFPIEITNYTQIHKHGIHITRSALKQGVRYDSDGIWQDKLKKTGLRHMKGMEQATLRGVRATRNTTNEDGDTVPERFTGGIEYFLKQWELGTTGNGAIATYRPGGSDITATAWASDDDKRIIDLSTTLTIDQFDTLIERAFRYTSETSFEKLVLCGSGFLKAVQSYCKLQSIVMRELNPKTDTFGLQMYRLSTIYGDLVFKAHPLLSHDSTFRNDAYILDLPCFKWRPLTDSDTEFLEGRQDNDFDGRKDCWLTEGGYEINFPENHMYIKNLTGITP